MYTIGNMILCTVIRLGATLSLSIGITVYSKLLITVTGMDWTLGRVVIDIGVFIGDSSIYFALRGAKRVIAVEPHSEAYKKTVENIS